jgi:hypothetical protein
VFTALTQRWIDWWYAKYCNQWIATSNRLSGFELYIRNQAALPPLTWTKIEQARRQTTHPKVFPQMLEEQMAPRFTSAQLFEGLLVPAVLWNRDYSATLYGTQFSQAASYSVKAEQKTPGKWLFHMRLPDDVVGEGGDFLLPPERSLIRIDWDGSGDAQFAFGQVVRLPGNADTPFGVLARDPHHELCHLSRIHNDISAERTLKGIEQVIVHIQHKPQRPRLRWQPYSIRNFILGRPTDPATAKNWIVEYMRSPHTDGTLYRSIYRLVTITLY